MAGDAFLPGRSSFPAVSTFKHCLSLLVLLAAPILPAQTTLLTDTFSTASSPGDLATNGPQGTQSLPSSAQWFLVNSANGSATYTNPALAPPGSLAQTFSVDQSVVAYFESPGNEQVLNVGDSIALNVNFNISGSTNLADGIRFALLNSGSSGVTNFQLTGNSSGNTSTTPNFNNYSGIAAFINPSVSSGTGANLDSRASGGTSDLISSGSTDYTSFGSSSGTATLSGGAYKATLSLAYTAVGSMNVGLVILDSSNNPVTTYSAAATTSSFPTKFDTVAIGGLTGVASSLTLNGVSVIFVPVPEPPVYLLCGGGLAILAGAAWWRRRRAARAA
ncbi:MAG TPA: hypothetical protein VFB27_04265 [Opitutaceae bacterium]|nr:hypothetical protein [Opitutaceae bacterium]